MDRAAQDTKSAGAHGRTMGVHMENKVPSGEFLITRNLVHRREGARGQPHENPCDSTRAVCQHAEGQPKQHGICEHHMGGVL